MGAAALVGLGWNAWSGRGFVLGQSVFVQTGDEVIEPSEAKARLDRGALFLDARPTDFWKMSHIPGALSLPEDGFDKAFAELEPKLRGTARPATSWPASCARRGSTRRS